jgi:hypothetical protein
VSCARAASSRSTGATVTHVGHSRFTIATSPDGSTGTRLLSIMKTSNRVPHDTGSLPFIGWRSALSDEDYYEQVLLQVGVDLRSV